MLRKYKKEYIFSKKKIKSFIRVYRNYIFNRLFNKNNIINKISLFLKFKKIINCSYSLYLSEINKLVSLYKKDIEACYLKDPSLLDQKEGFVSHNGFQAILIYRLAHLLTKYDVSYLPRQLSQYALEKTSIDIHPKAIIGESFFIDHGLGVVIGETTIIGNNVSIYQGVTLGALSLKKGQKLKNKKRHPTIEDGVVIYANALILGGDTVIGASSVIGANTFITKSVEPHSIVASKEKLLIKKVSSSD